MLDLLFVGFLDFLVGQRRPADIAEATPSPQFVAFRASGASDSPAPAVGPRLVRDSADQGEPRGQI